MADITERDKNNLWAEMPPSGKKRLQQENSQPKPAPENTPDNKKGKKKNPITKRPQKSRRIKRAMPLKKRQNDRRKT